MKDVSILLNFTSRIAFEETDPLMSLVNEGEHLLFYDRLSVGECETEETERLEQAKEKVARLRNLLEARALSFLADEGKVRLLVVLDLASGLFHVGGKKLFPAQKVRLFKTMISTEFGETNPLLGKMEYCFIFLNDSSDELSNFYQTLAYDGISGSNGQEWIAYSDIHLNSERDKAIEGMSSPDETWELTYNRISPKYQSFQKEFDALKDKIALRLNDFGLGDEFKTILNEKVKCVENVEDFNSFDYDGTVKSCLKNLIGLSTHEFMKDSVFFILQYETNDVRTKVRHAVFAKSLVQLLSTIDDRRYQLNFKSNNIRTGTRLFVLGSCEESNINIEAIEALRRYTDSCLSALEESKWKENMKVIGEKGEEGYCEYSANAMEPSETDSYAELNAKLNETRTENQKKFLKLRRVPFFFGKKIDDWSWYSNVVEQLTKIYEFEEENDRPMYDAPKRITNDEMKAERKQATYNDLENIRAKLRKKSLKIKNADNLSSYLMERRKLMRQFAGAIEKLKKEMTKLGYFAFIFWLGVFSMIACALCYSYHFYEYYNSDPYYLIAIAFGAAGVLFVLASVIGQSCIKNKIHGVFDEIDTIYYTLQKNNNDFIDEVHERVKIQREADINKRNLDEVEDKLYYFNSHNKRIDLWKDHFVSISHKLDFILGCLGRQFQVDQTQNSDKKMKSDDFNIVAFPVMPFQIRQKYSNMKIVVFETLDLDNVTCFAKRLPLIEINE